VFIVSSRWLLCHIELCAQSTGLWVQIKSLKTKKENAPVPKFAKGVTRIIEGSKRTGFGLLLVVII